MVLRCACNATGRVLSGVSGAAAIAGMAFPLAAPVLEPVAFGASMGSMAANLGKLYLSGTTDIREGLKTSAKIALDVMPGNGAKALAGRLFNAGKIGATGMRSVEALSNIYEHQWGILEATPALDSLMDRLFE